jgi:hypothetical protein
MRKFGLLDHALSDDVFLYKKIYIGNIIVIYMINMQLLVSTGFSGLGGFCRFIGGIGILLA